MAFFHVYWKPNFSNFYYPLLLSFLLPFQNSSSASLELDLEHYVVPAPSSNSGLVYAANLTETPRSLTGFGVQNADGSGNTSSSKESSTTGDRPTTVKVFSCL